MKLFAFLTSSISLTVALSIGQDNIKLKPGENLWPKPQSIKSSKNYISVLKSTIQYAASDCDSVNNAFLRFYDKLSLNGKFDQRYGYGVSEIQDNISIKFYHPIKILVKFKKCEKMPNFEMDESYHLKVDCDNFISIQGNSNWGILHAFTTLSQMLWNEQNLNCTTIKDYPVVKHRGILLDTSRHYLPISTIKRQLEIMNINKFNVFHWHIVDDNSFPFASQVYPKLLNPWRPEAIYTLQDVSNLINFAANLGIRVIPEFDTPGHVKSWANVSPDFITTCPSVKQFTRPLNPIKDENYQIIENFISEIRSVFKDEYFHIGGDEVAKECWDNNEEIGKFMEENNIKDNHELEQYYIDKLLKIVEKNKFLPVVWQEVWENVQEKKSKILRARQMQHLSEETTIPIPDVKDLNKNVIIEVWKSWTFKEILPRVLAQGYKVILSAPWYLDLIKYGETYKQYYYSKIPDNLFGGEACLWGEFVDEVNLESRLWPSASAIGERLWSNPAFPSENWKFDERFDDTEDDDVNLLRSRMEAMRCYMRRLGYNANPIFPSSPCLVDDEQDLKFFEENCDKNLVFETDSGNTFSENKL